VTLVPNTNLAVGGSGASRTLTVTPAANQSGTATITVTVSDGVATATDTLVLTVLDVNHPPTISDAADQTVAEDTRSGVIAITIGDHETSVADLLVTAVSSNSALVPAGNLVFGGSGAHRTLVVIPAANCNGHATITVSVSDGALTTSDTFTMTVTAVNDLPLAIDDTATLVRETQAAAGVDGEWPRSTARRSIVADVLANDIDPDGDRLTVVKFTEAEWGTVSCTSVGRCAYTPGAAAASTDSFTYTVSDGKGGMATAVVTVSFIDLQVKQSASPNPVAVSEALTYTIVVTNVGTLTATGVILRDTLPSAASFTSAATAQGTCTHTSLLITCDLGNLLPGASATVTVVVAPTSLGALTNSTTAEANEIDSIPTNNEVTTTVTVAGTTCYLPEGATGPFFDTTFALMNPSSAPTSITWRFLKSDGTVVTRAMTVGGLTRVTLDAESIPELAAAEFSTVVHSDQAVVVDRTMRWDASGYGSHAETCLELPSAAWYLAEGATHSRFDLFYLIQNPNATQANVTVTYLRPPPLSPIVKVYLVTPQSRFTLWVNQEDPGLASTAVSAVITADMPVWVERAMYQSNHDMMFDAGHNSAAVTAPATKWFLADGATGPYFDLFILLANADARDAEVRATYLLPSGATVVKAYRVPGNSRVDIWVDQEAGLTDTPVSTIIESINEVPIIAERAMWWPGDATRWREGHNSAGATRTGTKWGLAGGELGGPDGAESYILVMSTSDWPGSVNVTLLFEDGTQSVRTFPLLHNSRLNIGVAQEFPHALGRRFGAVVESLGSPPPEIVVELSTYSGRDVQWGAGTNRLGTRLQ
jgi:uncharacterized repeat protein (TIGR01451 family)